MATKKKSPKKKKKPAKSTKPVRKKAAPKKVAKPAKKAAKKPAVRKVATKKPVSKKPARTKQAPAKGARAIPMVPPRLVNSRSGDQSGDLQGLSRREAADSESVDELLEEGNAFEAGVVSGVEEADDADESEVHTHEVLEDDVPDEYLDKD